MAPRKRRDVGRVKDSITPPPTATSTLVVNTCGFATLADEIYLEIVSHIPSVSIPTPEPTHLESYPEIRRSRHETLLSLTQTSRSLRRFFWRYLWQRIEVREGMKFGGKNDTLKDSRSSTSCKKYATELVRQLEIVTIRNPLLAQYVNYLDIFIGDYSAKAVLAELARCLSLFPNLHTVQIDVDQECRLPLEKMLKQTFEKSSYPQIRNVFIMHSIASFVASCPQARRVGFTQHSSWPGRDLESIVGMCPYLEELEDIGDAFWDTTDNTCNFIVNNFPNLRTIKFTIYDFEMVSNTNTDPSSCINTLKELNHLQTIIMRIPPPIPRYRYWPFPHQPTDKVKKHWIELARHILIHIQLRDNLEKAVVILDNDGSERRIVVKPESSLDSGFE